MPRSGAFLVGKDHDSGKPDSEFTINCTGDVVCGDVIQFTESVWGGSYRKPRHLGERVITVEVLRDSYGDHRQQHTFTIRVIDSTGYDPLKLGTKTTRKGRNIYRNGTLRKPWADENDREAVGREKHERGDRARDARFLRQSRGLVDDDEAG